MSDEISQAIKSSVKPSEYCGLCGKETVPLNLTAHPVYCDIFIGEWEEKQDIQLRFCPRCGAVKGMYV